MRVEETVMSESGHQVRGTFDTSTACDIPVFNLHPHLSVMQTKCMA